MAEIRMVVGLGNPGEEYVNTRHNVGFRVIDSIAELLAVEVKKTKFGARFGETDYKGKKLILLKPWQFMNRSGQAVATAIGFYKLSLSNLLVISDDLALEPGRIRIRTKGSSGGHNGLADIIEKLGTKDFGRLRIGIGASTNMSEVDYVLGRPNAEQRQLLDKAVERARDAVFCRLEEGIDEAMNRYNSD